MNAASPIRLLLADDHFMVRIGLVSSLNLEPDLLVVAEAANGREALEQYHRHRPDLVVMDGRMPGQSGAETVAQLRAGDAGVRVVMLSAFDGEEHVHAAVQAGACAFLNKSADRGELLQAIRAVHRGECYFPPAIAARIAARLQREPLTPRETDVLTEIVKGGSNKEIGNALAIAEGTVKLHVAHILTKLRAKDRTHAASLALRRGLVAMD